MPTVVSYTSASLMKMTLSEIGSISTIDNSMMLHHASMAETLINAKIAKKYTLPLTVAVPILETLATELAVYNVLTSRITIQKEHPWFMRFKNAMSTLDQIAKGDLSLVSVAGAVLAERSDIGEVWSSKQNYIPTFGEGSQEDNIQDSDKVQDELDERGL